MKAVIAAGRALRSSRKDFPGSMGHSAGWKPLGAYGGAAARPAKIAASINTYGGTDQASTTVFACTTLIADTLAGYEWAVTDERGDELERTTATDDLFDLLEEPWPEATYPDWAADVETDLCLVGNSYWLKEHPNMYGQPKLLTRFAPSDVRVATDKRDIKIGYTVRVKGVDIAFGLEDIIHYRTRNPLHKHYGMGIVEAMLRQLDSDLAIDSHITSFFTNGARIAGVLTVAEGMDDVQFERLKRQVDEDYGGPANAYRTLIAEKATDFKPVQFPPAALGVVDLSHLSEDKVLQGFGVPKFLLGGREEGGVPKMEQSQFIFYRRMLPRAGRFQDRTTLSLVGLWEGRKFVLKPDMSEPPSEMLDNAGKMPGAGASLNETRVRAGLPEVDDPVMDEPLVPKGFLPISVALRPAPRPQPRPNQQPPGIEPPQQPEDEDPELEEPEDNVPEPGEVQASVAQKAIAAPRPSLHSRSRKGRPLPLPPGRRGLGYSDAVWEAFTRLHAPPRPVAALLEVPDDEVHAHTLFTAPELPAGFEQRATLVDPGMADAGVAQAVLEAQARLFFSATPAIRSVFTDFFNVQRGRVLARLNDYRGASARTRAGAAGVSRVKDNGDALRGDSLWDEAVEREALLAAYMPLVDEYGEEAVNMVGRVVNLTLRWDQENPHIGATRDRLGELIVRINETTRASIAEQVEEGMRRGYGIPRIANGYADEGYKGIQGVFDQASAARAETIARSETAMIYNGASTASYRAAGVREVQVFDGTGDSVCADAAGSVWDVDRAELEPIGHPNCVRAFAPVVEV